MESTSVTIDGASDLVAEVERHVSYLRIALTAPSGDGWICCGELLTDSGLLTESVRSIQAGRGAPDLQVTTSLWFQAYAFRAALPVVAPFALGISGLTADPWASHTRIARNRPAAIAVTSPTLFPRTAEQAAHDLLAGHLAPMIDALAHAFTIGRRLLWGNAAASVATVLRALEGAPGADRSQIRDRAEELFDRSQPWLAGLGQFEVVAEAGQEGWYWTRTNCCLADRCVGGTRCDDCSLTAAKDLEAARRSALEAAGQEVAS
ncbi:MAG: IucA/IucC family C-terminal-domain containing protein [Aquihabitans sp.]